MASNIFHLPLCFQDLNIIFKSPFFFSPQYNLLFFRLSPSFFLGSISGCTPLLIKGSVSQCQTPRTSVDTLPSTSVLGRIRHKLDLKDQCFKKVSTSSFIRLSFNHSIVLQWLMLTEYFQGHTCKQIHP